MTYCEGVQGQCWGDRKRSTVQPCPVVTRCHTPLYFSVFMRKGVTKATEQLPERLRDRQKLSQFGN